MEARVYMDVDGSWVSGERRSEISWDFQECHSATGQRLKTWKLQRKDQLLYSEVDDRAEWGFLTFTSSADTEHEWGHPRVVRRGFASRGMRDNGHGRNDSDVVGRETVFAFTATLGPRTGSYGGGGSSSSALFTIGFIQDPVARYASPQGVVDMQPLWAHHFRDWQELIGFHYSDFDEASRLAHRYSSRLAEDALASVSESYRDIVALSARQVLGSTQFSGSPEKPLLFLKEISSNGNCQTVDVIFPAFPFFLYTNPQWLAYLLEPLLEHQLSGQYPNKYSMHDLGAHFPNLTGHPDGRDEYMPVEECGNMLIMGLALANALRHGHGPGANLGPDLPGGTGHANKVGLEKAIGWLSRSRKLWDQWTGYLVRESLIPHNQLCTDDFAGWLANQTNLALKGIIGIRAMSEISHLLGHDVESKTYGAIANEYIEKWQEYGYSRDGTHAKLAYMWEGSWTTLYNVYADSLLCFRLPSSSNQPGPKKATHITDNSQIPLSASRGLSSRFVPDSVYQKQSDWYPLVIQRFGLPLDSRHLYTKSDWQFFAAAVASRKTREAIIDSVASWVNETVTGTSIVI